MGLSIAKGAVEIRYRLLSLVRIDMLHYTCRYSLLWKRPTELDFRHVSPLVLLGAGCGRNHLVPKALPIKKVDPCLRCDDFGATRRVDMLFPTGVIAHVRLHDIPPFFRSNHGRCLANC